MGAPRVLIQLRKAWIPKGAAGVYCDLCAFLLFFCTGSVTGKAAFLRMAESDCDRCHIVNAGVNPKNCIKRGDSVKSRFPLASFCIVFLCACALGQSFDVNGQSTSPPGDKRTECVDDKTPPASSPNPNDFEPRLGIEHRRSSPGPCGTGRTEEKRLRRRGFFRGTRCKIGASESGIVVPAGLLRTSGRTLPGRDRRLQSRS